MALRAPSGTGETPEWLVPPPASCSAGSRTRTMSSSVKVALSPVRVARDAEIAFAVPDASALVDWCDSSTESA